jgi:hypothetical protein
MLWLRANLYTLILIIDDYVGTQPEFSIAVEYPVVRRCYHKEENKWIEGEVQVPSWRDLPARMPRSNRLFSPPPAHAGVALSSLPTMLINWLGCQFKHSKSAFWGQCYDPGSETNILNFLKVIINFRILIQIYLSLDPDPTETEMRPKHALLIQIDCPLDLDLGFLLKPYADVNPGFVTRPRSFISKPI